MPAEELHTYNGDILADGNVPPAGYHYCGEAIGKVCWSTKHALKPMPIARTTHGERPHLTGPNEGKCWCKPAWVECQCPKEHDGCWGHGDVQLTSDYQHRLSVFSSLSR